MMRNGIRLAGAALICWGLLAFAERPPPGGKAPAGLHSPPAGAQGPTPGARFLATLPYEARNKLRKDGRVVLELQRKRGYVHAVIRLERPIDEAYALITRPANQHSYVPHVTQSKTVGGRSEEGESVDYVVSVFLYRFNFRVQHWFYPERHRMEWALDPTARNELTEQVGSLQLYELDAKTTIAELKARVAVKDKFVSLVRSVGAKGEVMHALRALREYVATASVPRRDPATGAR